MRDPKTMRFIPETGIELKELSTYWSRRIQSGDVVVVEKQEQAAPKTAKASNAKQGGAKQ